MDCTHLGYNTIRPRTARWRPKLSGKMVWTVACQSLHSHELYHILCYSNCCDCYVLYNSWEKLQDELKKLESMLEGTERSRSEYIKKRTLQKLKVTKVFVTAVVAFFFCMLPTHLVWIWHDFAQGFKYECFKDILIFANILMYLNSALNPFIFRSVRGSSFTRLIAFCCKGFNKGRSSSWLSQQCFHTPRTCSSQGVEIERGKAIRVTRQSYIRSSNDLHNRDVLYETNVWHWLYYIVILLVIIKD